MTDEQLVAYLDAGQERLTEGARVRLVEAVEAVRMGTIFANDAKQHARWLADVARHSRQPQEGKNLAQLAADFGGLAGGLEVVRGQFELRN